MKIIFLKEEKNRLLIKKSFEIMRNSCRINRDKSLFFKKFYDEEINDIRIYPMNIDNDYKYYGNINGKGAYFNISEENKYLNFRIFLENISGLSKYASCGLQKVKENDDSSIYYHILNGRIISEIECVKNEDFLKEINEIKEIKPFVIKKSK